MSFVSVSKSKIIKVINKLKYENINSFCENNYIFLELFNNVRF